MIQHIKEVMILKKKKKKKIKNLKTYTVHQRLSFIYKTMLWYCLKCREKANGKNPRFAKTNKGKLIIYQNVQDAILENLDFSRSKKLGGY